MIYLVLGFGAGVSVATLIVATLMFLHRRIEPSITVIESAIRNAGPRPQGFIVEPPDPAEEVRENIITRNRRKGLDTHIDELL